MTKTHRLGLGQRLLNMPFRWIGARGLGADFRYVLTVRGRVSGRQLSTPIDVMSREGRRYLVAGDRDANWVKNARAAGEVELMRGGRRERLAVREVAPVAAAPVLHQYVEQVPIMRRRFTARHTDADDAFVSEVADHPVFELVPPKR